MGVIKDSGIADPEKPLGGAVVQAEPGVEIELLKARDTKRSTDIDKLARRSAGRIVADEFEEQMSENPDDSVPWTV